MITDAMLYVHGTGIVAQGAISYVAATGVWGDAICYAASQYSNITLDFGAVGIATSWPYVSQFPSRTEEAYPAAGYSIAEMIATGVPWGLHVQIMSAFNTMTSISFEVCSTASTTVDPVIATDIIAGPRVLTLAQMQVLGACYFIAVDVERVLRKLNFYATLVSTQPTTGTICAWFGPKFGGTL